MRRRFAGSRSSNAVLKTHFSVIEPFSARASLSDGALERVPQTMKDDVERMV